MENSSSIIETKLHRPIIPVDLVERPKLTNWLDKRHNRPLTLVSAPAGYGKSTLIASWVKQQPVPASWLSLDGLLSGTFVCMQMLLAVEHRSVTPKGTLKYAFKLVNDTCGHIAGDELLRRTARAISATVRTGAQISRCPLRASLHSWRLFVANTSSRFTSAWK